MDVTNNISISYFVHGEGSPIILLHGAVVDFNFNFVITGWVRYLTEQGFQVIGLNYRGYGESEKSSDPSFYGTANLAGDVLNLMEHLGLKRAAIVGYSLGSLIALDLIHRHPDRFSHAVLVATGDGLVGKLPYILGKIMPNLVQLISHETYPAHLPKHQAAYWNFFQLLKLDRDAMIAFSQADYPTKSREEVSGIDVPTLVISGEKDRVLGQGPEVAATLGNGTYFELQGANHFTLATEKSVKEAVAHFFQRSK